MRQSESVDNMGTNKQNGNCLAAVLLVVCGGTVIIALIGVIGIELKALIKAHPGRFFAVLALIAIFAYAHLSEPSR